MIFSALPRRFYPVRTCNEQEPDFRFTPGGANAPSTPWAIFEPVDAPRAANSAQRGGDGRFQTRMLVVSRASTPRPCNGNFGLCFGTADHDVAADSSQGVMPDRLNPSLKEVVLFAEGLG